MQVSNTVIDHINQVDAQTLLSLADNMASAASSFNSHGYDTFITARDVFKNTVNTLVTTEEKF